MQSLLFATANINAKDNVSLGMLPNIQTRFRKFIDYKTSMITDEDPLRGMLFF